MPLIIADKLPLDVALDLRFVELYRSCIRSDNNIVSYIANINAFAYTVDQSWVKMYANII